MLLPESKEKVPCVIRETEEVNETVPQVTTRCNIEVVIFFGFYAPMAAK